MPVLDALLSLLSGLGHYWQGLHVGHHSTSAGVVLIIFLDGRVSADMVPIIVLHLLFDLLVNGTPHHLQQHTLGLSLFINSRLLERVIVSFTLLPLSDGSFHCLSSGSTTLVHVRKCLHD